MKSLIERLSDNAACVRDLALSSLSELLLNPTAELEQKRQMLAEELLPGTLPMAKDASELVRRTATKTLGRIGQLDGQYPDKLVESIVKDLIVKLNDRADRVQIAAIEALGMIGRGAIKAIPLIEACYTRCANRSIIHGAVLKIGWDDQNVVDRHVARLINLARSGHVKSEERIQAVQQLSATNIASNYLYRILLERMWTDTWPRCSALPEMN